MIRHYYDDGSFGIEYEPGDLVRRVSKGLLSRPGDWGVVTDVENLRRPLRPGSDDWIISSICIRCSFDGTWGDSDVKWHFEPFGLPEPVLDWRELTPEHKVYEVCRHGGGGFFFSVQKFEWGTPHEDVLPRLLVWGGRESRLAQRSLSLRSRKIRTPEVKDVYPFLAEVHEA